MFALKKKKKLKWSSKGSTCHSTQRRIFFLEREIVDVAEMLSTVVAKCYNSRFAQVISDVPLVVKLWKAGQRSFETQHLTNVLPSCFAAAAAWWLSGCWHRELFKGLMESTVLSLGCNGFVFIWIAKVMQARCKSVHCGLMKPLIVSLFLFNMHAMQNI